MEIHSSSLVNNEIYIIEEKNKINNTVNILKGIRKESKLDYINKEEYNYEIIWFINVETIKQCTTNSYIQIPKLMRRINDYNNTMYDEEINLKKEMYEQNGMCFNTNDIHIYDYDMYMNLLYKNEQMKENEEKIFTELHV